jgi:hypothetical protein
MHVAIANSHRYDRRKGKRPHTAINDVVAAIVPIASWHASTLITK